MGEYADIEIDRGMNEYLDGIYQIGSINDDICDDNCSYIEGIEEPETILEFKTIKKETSKAWLLIMTGDAETWFPKSVCVIKGNLITVPKWLLDKIADWDNL